MNTFYTLTDKNTEYTNSRSQRFATLEQAREAAKQRIVRAVESREPSGNASLSGVYILRAVQFLEPETPIRTTTLVSTLPQSPDNVVALGHNPAGLTNKQVGVSDGWRLLDPDEIYSRASFKCRLDNQEGIIDAWENLAPGAPASWYRGYYLGTSLANVYRTKLTKSQLKDARA